MSRNSNSDDKQEETNMKKIIALVLSLALLLGCASALAETEKTYTGEFNVDDQFTIKWVAPEGYVVEDVRSGNPGTMIARLVPAEGNEDKPIMLMSIAFDEQYAEVSRLNDLDAETLAEIEATFKEEDEVEITYMETAYGTKLMMIRETEDKVDYIDFFTIYLGYQVEFVMTKSSEEGDAFITDEQIQTAIQFLSDVDFVPAEQ